MKLEQLKQEVYNSSLWQAWQGWYGQLNSRDQTIVRWAAAVTTVLVLLLLIVAPLVKKNQALQDQYQRSLSSFELMADNAHRFGGASSSSASGPILGRVMQPAKRYGISLSRYEQDGGDLRIWLDDVVFDDAISWMEQLQQQNIRASLVTVDRTASGRVNLRATLTQG
jgi:general secretion pathway protein M